MGGGRGRTRATCATLSTSLPRGSKYYRGVVSRGRGSKYLLGDEVHAALLLGLEGGAQDPDAPRGQHEDHHDARQRGLVRVRVRVRVRGRGRGRVRVRVRVRVIRMGVGVGARVSLAAARLDHRIRVVKLGGVHGLDDSLERALEGLVRLRGWG